MTNTVPHVDPFGSPYYAEALKQAAELAQKPALGKIANYEIVARLEKSDAEILIGRRPDGTLWVLKGFLARSKRTPTWQETRESEALRMHEFASDMLLPLGETLNLVSDSVDYLCLPYCQGGSLSDRVAAGNLDVSELAYHGLALASAIWRLHINNLVHGDVKPGNVLLGKYADEIFSQGKSRWRTYLSDLETTAAIGGPASWRMTPFYAAPEQISGANAAPEMDVWAWGATLRQCLQGITCDLASWEWLILLVEQSMEQDPDRRPKIEQIAEAYRQHVAFGSIEDKFAGNEITSPLVCYPLDTLALSFDWPGRSDQSLGRVKINMGWPYWLTECRRLYAVNSIPALARIDWLSTRVLGDPLSPDSLWSALRNNRDAATLQVSPDMAFRMQGPEDLKPRVISAEIPRDSILAYIRYLVMSLVEPADLTGNQDNLSRLRIIADAWEEIGEFESELDTALLAQALLVIDEPERARPYIIRACDAGPDKMPALGALRMYHLITGNYAAAAQTAMKMAGYGADSQKLRSLALAAHDLFSTGDYELFDRLLSLVGEIHIDVIDLIRLVADGRRGISESESLWPLLREHCTTIGSDTSTSKIRYLVEAAFQRDDIGYASRRADIARFRPTIRLPVNHRDRAAIEAVALSRDPADLRLVVRLNNRSQLWSADGHPEDPFVGLCMIAAQRYSEGQGSSLISSDTRELVAYSRTISALKTVDLLHGTRRCVQCGATGQTADLSLCGHCHRLLCSSCVYAASDPDRCVCGGDLTHPSPGQWVGLPVS